jgi:hypothetical protein
VVDEVGQFVARDVQKMLDLQALIQGLGRVGRGKMWLIEGAVRRNESRGAHYKPEFPERDDANFLKATITTYDTANDRPQTDYGPVDTSLVTPRARTYGKKADAPATDANAKLTESAVPSTVSSGAPV